MNNVGSIKEMELVGEVVNALRELQREDEEGEKRKGRKKRTVVLRKVIFRDPETVIKWSDGIDTHYTEMGFYDPEKSFEYCVLKKLIGEESFNIWRETCDRLKSKVGLGF